jgi:hypothetical protein
MPSQAPSLNFIGKTLACMRACNENPALNDEEMSKIAGRYNVTAEELIGWRKLMYALREKEAGK